MTLLNLFSRSYDPPEFYVPYPEEPPASETDEPLYASADSLSGHAAVDSRKPGKPGQLEYGPDDYARVTPRDQRSPLQPAPSEPIYFELESPPKPPPKPAKRPSEPIPSIGGGQKAQFSLVNAELKQRFANRSGS